MTIYACTQVNAGRGVDRHAYRMVGTQDKAGRGLIEWLVHRSRLVRLLTGMLIEWLVDRQGWSGFCQAYGGHMI